jgi:myo-inositol 2-dehydrogenase/D-chiro-inositol 1-dehydrogenase
MTSAGLISVGLIGAGRMGSFHAETLARRLPGTRLAAYGPAGLAAGCVRYDELKDE